MKLSLIHQYEPFKSEINEEMEEQYQRIEAEKDGNDGNGLEEMVRRMQELEGKMDASNE